MQIVDIPLEKIKVINRLRKTNEVKINELINSIEEIDLLHPIV